MKKKWIFYGVMALALAGGFAACNDDDDKDKKHETEQTEQTDTDDGRADDPADGKTEGEKTDEPGENEGNEEETDEKDAEKLIIGKWQCDTGEFVVTCTFYENHTVIQEAIGEIDQGAMSGTWKIEGDVMTIVNDGISVEGSTKLKFSEDGNTVTQTRLIGGHEIEASKSVYTRVE